MESLLERAEFHSFIQSVDQSLNQSPITFFFNKYVLSTLYAEGTWHVPDVDDTAPRKLTVLKRIREEWGEWKEANDLEAVRTKADLVSVILKKENDYFYYFNSFEISMFP